MTTSDPFDDDLFRWIRRLYSAVGATDEFNLSKFPASIKTNQKLVRFVQDFRGGMTDSDIEEALKRIIYFISHYEYWLTRYLSRHGRETVPVTHLYRNLQSLKVIRELANADKHAGAGVKGSDTSIHLTNFSRVYRMTSAPGGATTLTFDAAGRPVHRGPPGSHSRVILSADVLDQNGIRIGEIYDILTDALTQIGVLCGRLGISTPNAT